MIKENYNVIGIMSGTSLDGIDLAHISLNFGSANVAYSIGKAATIPYSNEWVQRLKSAVDYSPLQLTDLDTEYTALLASVIRDFMTMYSLPEPDAVCSHGHTILHQPENRITLQLGNLPKIASLLGHTVVCDFRVQDVAMGGQGAPLVPIGDRMLFSEYYYCLNLGGFSNISFEDGNNRVAFDICPVNTVLNYYANQMGLEYDDKGQIAASGTISEKLLEQLNALEFYRLNYPKSLGFEFVKTVVLPLMDGFNISVQDKIATFTEHIAVQITLTVLKQSEAKSMLVTGGGAYNKFLMERMAALLPNMSLVIPDDKTIQYKEALIFALLGVLKLRGEINVLSAVTGAPHDHSAGFIYLP